MKIKPLIILIVLLGSGFSFSQEPFLKFTNKTTGKVKTIENSKRIIIKTNKGIHYRGQFLLLDDNHIQIQKKIVPLEDIKTIKRKNIVTTLIGGYYLLFGAGGVAAVGAAVISKNEIESEIAVPLLLIGGFGYGITQIHERKPRKKWEIEIVRP